MQSKSRFMSHSYRQQWSCTVYNSVQRDFHPPFEQVCFRLEWGNRCGISYKFEGAPSKQSRLYMGGGGSMFVQVVRKEGILSSLASNKSRTKLTRKGVGCQQLRHAFQVLCLYRKTQEGKHYSDEGLFLMGFSTRTVEGVFCFMAFTGYWCRYRCRPTLGTCWHPPWVSQLVQWRTYVIVSRLSRVIDVGIGVGTVPRGVRADTRHGFLYSYSGGRDCFKAFTGYWCRMGIVPHAACADTRHMFLNSYSGRHDCFKAFTGYWCRYRYRPTWSTCWHPSWVSELVQWKT